VSLSSGKALKDWGRKGEIHVNERKTWKWREAQLSDRKGERLGSRSLSNSTKGYKHPNKK
jgi:hypothetical protein